MIRSVDHLAISIKVNEAQVQIDATSEPNCLDNVQDQFDREKLQNSKFVCFNLTRPRNLSNPETGNFGAAAFESVLQIFNSADCAAANVPVEINASIAA